MTPTFGSGTKTDFPQAWPGRSTRRPHPGQLLVLRPGVPTQLEAKTNVRATLLGGETMDGPRHIWWNVVSSSKERIEQAKADWKSDRFAKVEGDDEFIPLPDSPGP